MVPWKKILPSNSYKKMTIVEVYFMQRFTVLTEMHCIQYFEFCEKDSQLQGPSGRVGLLTLPELPLKFFIRLKMGKNWIKGSSPLKKTVKKREIFPFWRPPPP